MAICTPLRPVYLAVKRFAGSNPVASTDKCPGNRVEPLDLHAGNPFRNPLADPNFTVSGARGGVTFACGSDRSDPHELRAQAVNATALANA